MSNTENFVIIILDIIIALIIKYYIARQINNKSLYLLDKKIVKKVTGFLALQIFLALTVGEVYLGNTQPLQYDNEIQSYLNNNSLGDVVNDIFGNTQSLPYNEEIHSYLNDYSLGDIVSSVTGINTGPDLELIEKVKDLQYFSVFIMILSFLSIWIIAKGLVEKKIDRKKIECIAIGNSIMLIGTIIYMANLMNEWIQASTVFQAANLLGGIFYIITPILYFIIFVIVVLIAIQQLIFHKYLSIFYNKYKVKP